jgi:hypothetical protein
MFLFSVHTILFRIVGLTTDWTTGAKSPSGAKDFSSSLCVQTSSEAHPASYPMGTGSLSPGVKRELPLPIGACLAACLHIGLPVQIILILAVTLGM